MSAKRLTLTQVQAAIVALIGQHDEALNAPPSHAEVRAALVVTFEREAANAAASIARALRWPERGDGLRLRAQITATPAGQQADLTSLFATFMGPDAILAALEPHIQKLLDGPSNAQRVERLAAIADELDRLENVEEDLVSEAEAAGVPVARRGDARPEIVLRVRDV